MDTDQFDLITKRLATGRTSRRRLLRGLGGAVTSTLLTGLGVRSAGAARGGCKAAGKHCTKAGQCCAGFVCDADGACQPSDGVGLTECPDGRTVCDATCADLQTDIFNCGTCGNLCHFHVKSGSTCIGGACQCPADTRECELRCAPLCSVAPDYYRTRFQECLLSDQGQGSCHYCTEWTGCVGDLDTQTYCHTVANGCGGPIAANRSIAQG